MDFGPITCCEIDKSILVKLISRGLVYLDVPIKDDDYFYGKITNFCSENFINSIKRFINICLMESDCSNLYVMMFLVPTLDGFVMNRVQGDYFETLLYKIFVTIDGQTTVKEVVFRK